MNFKNILFAVSAIVVAQIVGTNTLMASEKPLSASEIKGQIVGRCFKTAFGKMQLNRDGTFWYKANKEVDSYDGTYVIGGGFIKSSTRRTTKFFNYQGRIYARFHGSRTITRVRFC